MAAIAEVWAAVGHPASQFRSDPRHASPPHGSIVVDKDDRVTPEASALVAAVDVLSDRARLADHGADGV
jgi:hypothetical protein